VTRMPTVYKWYDVVVERVGGEKIEYKNAGCVKLIDTVAGPMLYIYREHTAIYIDFEEILSYEVTNGMKIND